MKACVNIGGILTESFKIKKKKKIIKQGVIFGTIFSLYFSIVFANAFKDCNHGIDMQYRTTDKTFKARRFTAKTKTFTTLIRDLLYAYDRFGNPHSI